eukprot:CAMPEP_0169099028 /NCGR_PEP_ID=MMETSP1015-20121227/20349_1 /TAXON_ID=342587 /ORGANISM="Karlodinium micrum, Strain CCMP2283" /LENGTH=147 /DNA_ID=CAMNT_0009159903 /DNA_START=263 /DNA_END=706 /DNA_ORIENTATION=-
MEEPPNHAKVRTLFESMSTTAVDVSRALKQNTVARSVAIYVPVFLMLRVLRSYGFFQSFLDVFIIAFPCGAVTCWAISRHNKAQMPNGACVRCREPCCDGRNCPTEAKFWGDLPGAADLPSAQEEPVFEEVTTASVLAGVDELLSSN